MSVAALIFMVIAMGVFEWRLYQLKRRVKQAERGLRKVSVEVEDNTGALDTLLEQRRRRLAGEHAE